MCHQHKIVAGMKGKEGGLASEVSGQYMAGRGLFGCTVDWKQRAEVVKPHGVVVVRAISGFRGEKKRCRHRYSE